MQQNTQINEIYTHLPPIARQEALDFLLFLQHQYSNTENPIEKKAVEPSSIRNNPAFGMWADRQTDSADLLQQIKKEQWG